jgi:hypothetical protein
VGVGVGVLPCRSKDVDPTPRPGNDIAMRYARNRMFPCSIHKQELASFCSRVPASLIANP